MRVEWRPDIEIERERLGAAPSLSLSEPEALTLAELACRPEEAVCGNAESDDKDWYTLGLTPS